MSSHASRTPAVDEAFRPDEVARGLDVLAGSLVADVPPPALWDRIASSTQAPGRFYRFTDHVARLLDVAEDKARELLDRAADPSAFVAGLVPGMGLLNVQGGPAVAHAITGFIRLPSATQFPEHKHLGQESVLVMQGRIQDGADVAGPGDLITMPAGSSHSFFVPPGPDLLYLAVVQDGIQVGDAIVTPDDPRV
jgi:hypothetical protein